MAVRKLRILAVENDPEWLELILLLFPDHLVKPVRYYADALPMVEAENMAYDAAIVDLNLIDLPATTPPGRRRRDMLGGELLLKLYEARPATLRIALTGVPPGGPVLEVVTRFHVDEFFWKDDLDLADLRRVVMESPAAKAAAQETAEPGIDAQVADQRYRLQAWADVRRAQLDQQLEDHEDDLRAAARIAVTDGDDAVDEAALRSAVERDKAQLAALSAGYARIAETLDEAQSTADVARVARVIDRLMGAAPGAVSAS